jgi:hypothetical protein
MSASGWPGWVGPCRPAWVGPGWVGPCRAAWVGPGWVGPCRTACTALGAICGVCYAERTGCRWEDAAATISTAAAMGRWALPAEVCRADAISMPAWHLLRALQPLSMCRAAVLLLYCRMLCRWVFNTVRGIDDEPVTPKDKVGGCLQLALYSTACSLQRSRLLVLQQASRSCSDQCCCIKLSCHSEATALVCPHISCVPACLPARATHFELPPHCA